MMTRLRNSLQARLVLIFTLVLLIPTLIIGYYGINSVADTLLDKISSEQLRSVISLASLIETRLVAPRDDLLVLSQSSVIESLLAARDDDTRRPLVNQVAAFLSDARNRYTDVRIIDLAGREVARVTAQGDITSASTPNLASQLYFSQTIGLPTGQYYVSGVEADDLAAPDPDRITPVLHYSTPLQSVQGNTGGVLVLTAYLDPLLQEIIDADAEGAVTLVDREGFYILNNDPTRLFGGLRGHNRTLDSDQPNDIVSLYGNPNGTLSDTADQPNSLQVFASIRPPSHINLQWLLLIQTPFEIIFGEIYQARLVIIGVSAVALAIAIVTAILLTNGIVRPLRQLSTVADQVRESNWSVVVPDIDSQDEIGRLASAFSRMVAELKSIYTSLEQRVEARTRDLEAIAKQNAALLTELSSALETALQAEKAKSVFLASMSHELRTPLNAIINFTSFVVEGDTGPINDQQKMLLTEVVTSSNHLLNLINDVLDMSKIEAGSLNLFIEEDVDIAAIVRETVSTGRALIHHKPIELHVDIAADLPLIRGDRQRLLQVLLNIMSNACKFTKAGTIAVRAHQVGDEVVIAIKDSGPGILLEDQQMVFQAFKQTTTGLRQGGGTGLGMPIARNLVDAHGGSITLESEPGLGTTFSVSLPIRSALLQPTLAHERN